MAEPKEAPPTPAVQQPPHPLDAVAGIFENEPLWDELMEEIRKNRERDAKLSSRVPRSPRPKTSKQPISSK
jgi:hypothetical protein